jgi:hypothetical protein
MVPRKLFHVPRTWGVELTPGVNHAVATTNVSALTDSPFVAERDYHQALVTRNAASLSPQRARAYQPQLRLRRRRLRQRQSAQSAQLCKIARTPFNVLTHRASTVCASTRRTTHIVPRPAFANHIIATAAVVCQARMPLFARLKGKDLCAADLEQWIATASTSLRISTIATVVDSSVQPIAHHAKAELVFVRRHRRPQPRPRQPRPRQRLLLRQPDAATAQLAALDASQTCSNPIAMTLPFAMQSACSQLAPAVVQRHQRHLVRRHLVQRHLVQPLHRIAVVRARSSVLM